MEQVIEQVKEQWNENKINAIQQVKRCKGINFIEHNDGEYTIGYIDDLSKRITLQYLEDTLGKYLNLVYVIEKTADNIDVSILLSRWIVHGRYRIIDDKIILYSIFPILDEQFIGRQISQAINEIRDMNNIVNNALRRGVQINGETYPEGEEIHFALKEIDDYVKNTP